MNHLSRFMLSRAAEKMHLATRCALYWLDRVSDWPSVRRFDQVTQTRQFTLVLLTSSALALVLGYKEYTEPGMHRGGGGTYKKPEDLSYNQGETEARASFAGQRSRSTTQWIDGDFFEVETAQEGNENLNCSVPDMMDEQAQTYPCPQEAVETETPPIALVATSLYYSPWLQQCLEAGNETIDNLLYAACGLNDCDPGDDERLYTCGPSKECYDTLSGVKVAVNFALGASSPWPYNTEEETTMEERWEQ